MLVIALERGFYGGKIQEPPEAGGEPFHILKESDLGKWMQPQGWKPSGKAEAATTSTGTNTTAQQAIPLYTAKSNGGGRFKVWYTPVDPDAEAGWFSDFVSSGEGAKEAAQAEADRLNAGGEPYMKSEAATTSTGSGSQGGETAGDGDGNQDDDDDGPDA